MEDLESKIGSIMSNPELMSQIMSLAQSLGHDPEQQKPPAQDIPNSPLPEIDLQTLQKLSGLAGQSNIDANQRNLLSALGPYLSNHRITKLEKAMRAAKLAGMASVFFANAGR